MRSGARLIALGLLLVPVGTRANDLYVSPQGTPSGPGTMSQAYDLATALSGAVGHPGDTFWLMGGNYVIGHINTTIHGASGQPITFRSVAGEWARVNGSLSFFNSAGYVILRDFELYSSDTNRVSTQTNAGLHPTDINPVTGISSYVPNMSFINLIVHDETGEGIYISESSEFNLAYGCLVYNNGWRSPDNAEGHGFYVQGTNGNRQISDNISFNNSGISMQVYEDSATQPYLMNVTLDGNVAFNAGTIQNSRAYRDWVIGVDAPAISADAIVFENNMAYYPQTSGQEDRVQIGRAGVNGSVTILYNYLPPGLELNNWSTAVVAGNMLSAQNSNYTVSLNQTQSSLTAYWDDNVYGVPTNIAWFLNNSNALVFPSWQNATGYDQGSVIGLQNVSQTQIFVRSNLYEPGRANIVAYNWDDADSVTVDVSSVLVPGTPYEVRNAEDFFAAPVLTGIFDGNPLNLPMNGLTVAAPNGPMTTAQPTGPTFNVFVLQPRVARLRVAVSGGQLRITWPTNAVNWVLQSSPSLSAAGPWANVTIIPTVAAGQFLITEPTSQQQNSFYRLQAQ